jgi:hypothetical protein
MDLRREALLMLENSGTVLDTARVVSRLLRQAKIKGAVIGGIAVVLHGHVRTTRDVDVLMWQPLEDFARVLGESGATHDREEREFLLEGVPVHLVPEEMGGGAVNTEEIEGVLTIGLADLVEMKLRSGMKNLARAQDLADVVGLIRARKLGSAFAAKLDKNVRPEFRKLVKAVEGE